MTVFWRDFLTGALNARVWKIAIFDKYLGLSRKWYKKSHSYYRRQIGNRTELANGTIFNDLERPLTQFQGHAIIWRYLRNGKLMRYIVTMKYLHVPYSRVSFRMTLSDFAKYSLTRSIARSLCDSRACCSMCRTEFNHRMHVSAQHDV